MGESMSEALIKLLDPIVKIISYIGMLVGLWILLTPMIKPLIYRKKSALRIRRLSQQRKTITQNRLIKHLEMLLRITQKADTTYALATYFVITIILCFMAFLIANGIGVNLLIKAIVVAIAAAIPYVYLRVKLHEARIEASYEAERVITELNNQYRINYLNMIEAIDKTVINLKDCPYSKKALLRLGMAAKQYRNSAELEEIVNEFTFAIDTKWSVLLANNISLSIEYGDDVSESMNDIIKEVENIKKVLEVNKQVNNEAFFMIKYFAPLTYLAGVYAAVAFFGFTFEKFIKYQLNTPLGLKFFIVSVGAIILNYIIYHAVKKPKYDY